MIVIDDKLAFVDGFDLTRSRWDTPEHAAANPLRRDANEQPHHPFPMSTQCSMAIRAWLHRLLTQADLHDWYRWMSEACRCLKRVA